MDNKTDLERFKQTSEGVEITNIPPSVLEFIAAEKEAEQKEDKKK